jgi:hypothetical protein
MIELGHILKINQERIVVNRMKRKTNRKTITLFLNKMKVYDDRGGKTAIY